MIHERWSSIRCKANRTIYRKFLQKLTKNLSSLLFNLQCITVKSVISSTQMSSNCILDLPHYSPVFSTSQHGSQHNLIKSQPSPLSGATVQV